MVHELNRFVQAEWRRRRDNRLKQTKVAERGRSPPNPTYDRLSFYIDPRNLAEGAGNELCTRLIDYRFVFSVKGMIQFWREEHTFGFCSRRNVHFVHIGNVENVARFRFRSLRVVNVGRGQLSDFMLFRSF